jgi:acetoin:2,6-dichlorophenolindophenol oxidoreductase subunit alpha
MAPKQEYQQLLGLYRVMLRIRAAEEHLIKLFADNEVPGFIHLSIGQEAVAAGVMASLESRDTIATTHRGHGHVIARGVDLGLFFKEVMGKAGGVCRGRGGSMHIADLSLGVLGANGIVGAGIPIAMGSAVAHSVRKTGGVAVVFFGDGAMAEGVLHETLNLAALWRLPLVLVCENNGWSEFSPTSRQFSGTLRGLAAAFGIDYTHVDGSDVQAVAKAAEATVGRARAGAPGIVECATRRVRGHYEGDPQKYRDPQEIAALDAHDPLRRALEALTRNGESVHSIAAIAAEIEAEMTAAIAAARADALPDFDAALADVYTTRV